MTCMIVNTELLAVLSIQFTTVPFRSSFAGPIDNTDISGKSCKIDSREKVNKTVLVDRVTVKFDARLALEISRE